MINKHSIKLISLLGAMVLSTSAFADTPNKATTPAATTAAAATAAGSFTPTQVKNIQQIVHDYLVQNPDVLVEASQALQKQTEEKQQNFAMNAIQQNAQAIFDDTQSPVLGNPNGDVILVEFYDYQCGHCKQMGPVIKNIIDTQKNVKVIFKELPIFGANSKYAAQAALASAKQNKFAEFHQALLAASNPLSNEAVLAVAKKVGLNITQLKKDMDSVAVTKELTATLQLAQALRIAGTPSFVIGNKAQTQFGFIPGATTQENLEKELQQVR